MMTYCVALHLLLVLGSVGLNCWGFRSSLEIIAACKRTVYMCGRLQGVVSAFSLSASGLMSKAVFIFSLLLMQVVS